MHKSTDSKCYYANSQFERHSVLGRDKIIFAKLSDYHSVLDKDKVIFAKLSQYHSVLERDKIIFAKLSHYHSVLERDKSQAELLSQDLHTAMMILGVNIMEQECIDMTNEVAGVLIHHHRHHHHHHHHRCHRHH